MANPTNPIRNRDENRGGSNPLGERTWETASSMTEKARDVASSAAQTAGETAAGVAQRAKDVASSATQRASEVTANVGQKAAEATSAVGGRIRGVADTLRESLPHEGMMGTASSALADTLDRSGRYLEEEGLRGMADDLTNLVRRNPIPALFLGIGVGFLLGRSLRR